MFIKNLKIETTDKVIRDIRFHKGLNLIVDDSEDKVTGNNVGKTTVLKLIDFCLGANAKGIYQDPENPKQEYSLVKSYLVENDVWIKLVLSENLDGEESNEIVIQRNFQSRNKIKRYINGQSYTADEFEPKLLELIFPEHTASKPTFRQIISHNIRYKDLSITNTLRTLDKFTTDAEYESLYLFLLGCDFTKGDEKVEILQKIKQEETFQRRLEKKETRSAYETALAILLLEIEGLNSKKKSLNVNENFEADLEKLNQLKYQINRKSSEQSKLAIRREIIKEAEQDLKEKVSSVDLEQLRLLYQQVSANVVGIQKSFEDMVSYHNKMLDEKSKFITSELPLLNQRINTCNTELTKLVEQEKELADVISKSDSYEELEQLILELNEKHTQKGEYESIIAQLDEVETNLSTFRKELTDIEQELFSDDFEETVKAQRDKFNKHFSSVSDTLYGEKYALQYEKKRNNKGQLLYKFSSFNLNFSSGKKQGEISCFDIAYTTFADEENIPCLHFLLNDKKELMHGHQLVKIAELVNKSNLQFVASILKDKLPAELDNPDNFILHLSEDEKLFRIENHGSDNKLFTEA